MSYSQPPRRPQGARQRTQDSDRRPSVSQSGTEAWNSITEDGIISSDLSSHGGARLSRSAGRRRGIAPSRSSTTGTNISMDSSTNTGTDHMSSRNHIVQSPDSERPDPTRSNSDFVPFFRRKDSKASDDFDPMVYASPSPSLASLRRGSEPDEGRPRALTTSGSNANTPSVHTSSLPPVHSIPTRKSSMPRLFGDNPVGSSNVPPVPPVPPLPAVPLAPPTRTFSTAPTVPIVVRGASIGDGNESDASNSSAPGTGRKFSRWDTIRKAVHPRQVTQIPPSRTPTPSGLKVTPASSVISSTSAYGAASTFSVPRAGSAITSLSEAGMAPPPSIISATSSNLTTGSRSARAVMRNVVEQARSGVAGMSTGLGGLAGFGGLVGNSGMGARGGAMMTNSMMEENTPFAKDLLQACWTARFGGESKAPESRTGIMAGMAHFPAINTFSSSNSSGIRRPMRKATTDGSMAVPGGSLIHQTQQQQPPPPSTPALASVNLPSGNKTGGLQALHHIIVNNASLGPTSNQPVSRPRTLPFHSLILSTLLIPFVNPPSKDEHEKKATENEQGLAVEIFGLVTRTWTTVKRPQDEVERWMWCCQAASQESVNGAIREWLLSTLDKLITGIRPSYIRLPGSSNDLPPSPLQYPTILQSLLQHLYFVYPQISGVGSAAVQNALNALIGKLERGDGTVAFPELQMEAMELEYGVSKQSTDTERELRTAIVTEAAVRLLENGSEALRRWFLLYLVEHRWPLPGSSGYSTLRAEIEYRKNRAFLSAILSFIRSFMQTPDSASYKNTATTITMLLQTRVIPAVDIITGQIPNDLRPSIISVLFELLNTEEQDRSYHLLSQWMHVQGSWKDAIDLEVKRIILNDSWDVVIRFLSSWRRVWSGRDGDSLSNAIIPSLFERLVSSPQVEASPTMGSILTSLAKDYPREFYKPLFLCAGSSNKSTVATQLRILTAIYHVYPTFWIDNAKMMLMALMGEPGAAVTTGKGKQRAGEAPKWGKARLGQCVLYLELIGLLRRLRKSKKDESSAPPGSMSRAADFFLELEAKIPVLLEAKESTTLCPFSIRLLLASLMLEIRLFTRSLKSAPWLPRFLEWACTSHSGAMIYPPTDPSNDQGGQRAWTPVTDEVINELENTLESIRGLYSSSWLESMGTPRTAPRGLPAADLTPQSGQVMKSAELQHNLEILASLTSASHAIFQLLVAVSGILQDSDYDRLGPILWKHFLDTAEAATLGPIVFLLMQGAEKGPSAPVVTAVTEDLTGESAFLKRRAIERLTKLFSWRYQVLNQPVITDRSHRRPFRSGRPPLSFVPTDIGSANYIADRPQEVDQVQFASTLPPEIRRRLIELGWDRSPASEEGLPVREALPLSVSPSDRLAIPETTSLASMPSETVQRGVMRRKSSGGGYGGGKKRSIFVPSLAMELQLVLRLTMSNDPEIANISRHFLLETLRDEPALFIRPVFEQLSELRDIGASIATLENTFRLQLLLPPPFTFLVFNHLAGLLKALTRDPNAAIAPMVYAYSLPSISNAVSHVSGMSIRELRKAKLDPMLLPSGSLWFSEQMLPGPMFPRSLPTTVDPFQPLPPTLVAITMIRTAQNMTLINLLKRDPREIHSIRKTFTNFTLPALSRGAQGEQRLQLVDFLPGEVASSDSAPQPIEEKHLLLISLALARSHLLLVAQIFRCLSRQTNDHQEVFQLLDGVNRIMLRHGNDLGIVTHSMIDYMLAMTRFRRIFSSNGGFMLIMPAIWKVYTEAENGNKSIRDVIRYAITRFHALHTEAFIFQSIDAAAAMISLPSVKAPEAFASSVTSLFSPLASTARGEANTGGIQNMTKPYEREAIINSFNESPEALMAAINNGQSMSSMVDQFESKPFPLENLARLFLTVVADDPLILRAQHFLTLFRYITPSLYNNSMAARTVIREGIKALGSSIFSKTGITKSEARSKLEANQPTTLSRTPGSNVIPRSAESMFAKADGPSNFNAMKRDYLHLIVAFTKAGGQLHIDAIRRALDLLKTVLRDSSSSAVQGVSLFLREFTESSFLRDTRPTAQDAVALLSDISPLIYNYGYAIDFSGVFDVLTRICEDEHLIEDPSFMKMVDGFCRAGLDALEEAAASNTLRGIQFRQSFVSFIVVLVQRPNTDPLRFLSERSHSAGFLASFVLNVTFQLPLTSSMHSATNSLRRAWLRLLGYALSAFEGKDITRKGAKVQVDSTEVEKQPSNQEGPQSSQRGLVATMLLALQVLKVIMVRAGEEIEVTMPDVWLRVSSVVKDILQDGNGVFSLAGFHNVERSPSLSPNPSRPGSPIHSTPYLAGSSPQPRTQEQPPRAVDYGIWSILEMLCFYRTPLNTKLRLWLQEKLGQLEARREALGAMTPIRASPGRDPRRQSFSPFTKRRRSGVPSIPPSPEGSPSLRASRTSGAPPMLQLGSASSMSTFDRFPQASPLADGGGGGLRIRHLGPEFQIREAKRQSGPSNPLRMAVKLVNMTRPKLVEDSHRRVAAVRVFWGYEAFTGEDMSAFEAWTTQKALRRIFEEARELTREFYDIAMLEPDEY